jgi:hypothetical protein
MSLLSGLIFTVENIPAGGLRRLSNLVQARYYIVVVRDAFLQGAGCPRCGARMARDAAHAGERMTPRFWSLALKELRQIHRDHRPVLSLIVSHRTSSSAAEKVSPRV